METIGGDGMSATMVATKSPRERELRGHGNERLELPVHSHRNVTLIDPAYAAGLFDGEGCVVVRFGSTSANRTDRSFHVAVEITNTYLHVLEALQATYGGRLYAKSSEARGRSKLRAWTLRWMGEDCERFARTILPHSIIKREQLEILLEARAMLHHRKGTFRLPTSEIAAREAIVARMLAAKKEGTVPW